jgi:hypothetical protein
MEGAMSKTADKRPSIEELIAAAALAWRDSDDEDRAVELEALLSALGKVRP